MRRIIKVLLCSSVIVLSACSIFENDYVANSAVGGASGAALGAGTGALVGSMISNGDVGQSALLGSGIGLGVGIIAGAGYTGYKRHKVLSDNNETIRENYEYIVSRQEEIDGLREELLLDSRTIVLDESLKAETYVGPTIGVAN